MADFHENNLTAMAVSGDISRHASQLDATERRRALGYTGATIWLTGLSGSGKSTVACALEGALVLAGRPVLMLDGDNLRHGLNVDLGFSEADRHENVRRVGEVAALAAAAGVVVLVALISPFRAGRERARQAHRNIDVPFCEVFVDTPLAECERRDPKGLYARARAGQIADMTGLTSPYEAPEQPDVELSQTSVDEAVSRLHTWLAIACQSQPVSAAQSNRAAQRNGVAPSESKAEAFQ